MKSYDNSLNILPVALVFGAGAALGIVVTLLGITYGRSNDNKKEIESLKLDLQATNFALNTQKEKIERQDRAIIEQNRTIIDLEQKIIDQREELVSLLSTLKKCNKTEHKQLISEIKFVFNQLICLQIEQIDSQAEILYMPFRRLQDEDRTLVAKMTKFAELKTLKKEAQELNITDFNEIINIYLKAVTAGLTPEIINLFRANIHSDGPNQLLALDYPDSDTINVAGEDNNHWEDVD